MELSKSFMWCSPAREVQNPYPSVDVVLKDVNEERLIQLGIDPEEVFYHLGPITEDEPRRHDQHGGFPPACGEGRLGWALHVQVRFPPNAGDARP